MIFTYVLTAWKAVRSVATITGYEVPGDKVRTMCLEGTTPQDGLDIQFLRRTAFQAELSQ